MCPCVFSDLNVSVVVLDVGARSLVLLDVVVLDVVVLSLVLRSVGAGPPPHLRNVVSPAPTARTTSIHTFRIVVSSELSFMTHGGQPLRQ
jgi:hypothetical protein